mmetsp:Transcript_34539/g.88612  ORF Transcript_34539/g.88612 Transcript_34539/m.88612 type:complete len:186 (-) Transcript_34539:108-665(-)
MANAGKNHVVGKWEDGEFVIARSEGADLKLPYEIQDTHGFRDSEISDFAWTFKVSDILGDGLISTKEVRRCLDRLGEAPTDKEFLKVMNDVDPHARGVVDFQRFVKIMGNFDRSMLTEDELTNAFKIFDTDKSGSIDAVEMQELLQKMGFNITPLEAHAVLAEADDDNSGEVTYNEFVTKILQNQ